jgi:uncharacterized protein YjiS (DUF1127 family)
VNSTADKRRQRIRALRQQKYAAFSHQIRLAATERKPDCNHDNVSFRMAIRMLAEKIASHFAGVPPVTGAWAELDYTDGEEAELAGKRKRPMISLGIVRFRCPPLWSKLAALVAAWRQRAQFRYDVERLSERDLTDMRLTRLDAVNETEKPFWQA